jgi:hypothetical protein
MDAAKLEWTGSDSMNWGKRMRGFLFPTQMRHAVSNTSIGIFTTRYHQPPKFELKMQDEQDLTNIHDLLHQIESVMILQSHLGQVKVPAKVT